jgi:hypothetical protein
MEGQTLERGTAFVAPRSDLEQQVAAVWQQVLGCSRIGVEDDFFELGGHSLLATQVVARLRQLFPLDLDVRVLFESPTVARLAERLDLLLWSAGSTTPRAGAPGETVVL